MVSYLRGIHFRRFSEGWIRADLDLQKGCFRWEKTHEYGMRKIILDIFRTKVARHPEMEGMSIGEESDGSDDRSIRFRQTLKGRFDCCRIVIEYF